MSEHSTTIDMAHGAVVHDDSHEAGHHGPKRPVLNYVLTLAALLILTVVTVGVAQYDLGEANVLVAIVVATVKATLVALLFMHLLHDKPMNAIIFVTAIVMLGLLLAFCFLDSGTRDNLIPQNGMAPAGSDFNRPAKLGVPYGGEKKGKAEPSAEAEKPQ